MNLCSLPGTLLERGELWSPFHRSERSRVYSAVARTIENGLQKNPVFHFVLSGGHTPLDLYRFLATKRNIDWSRVHFWWGDERAVEMDSPWSNYAVAHSAWGAVFSTAILHRIPVERGRQAAEAYQREWEGIFGTDGGPDLVLLGLGPDGHTASLFPGLVDLNALETLWVTAPSLQPSVNRVTLSAAQLSRGKTVLFLSGRSGKEAVLADLYAGKGLYPARKVLGRESTIWLIEEE